MIVLIPMLLSLLLDANAMQHLEESVNYDRSPIAFFHKKHCDAEKAPAVSFMTLIQNLLFLELKTITKNQEKESILLQN